MDSLWATLTLLGMGFQAWLGKTVVDSNLLPLKITLHMAMACLLVVFLLILLFKNSNKKRHTSLGKYAPLVGVALGLTVLQIAIGTQVRQFVDIQMKQWVLCPVNGLQTLPCGSIFTALFLYLFLHYTSMG